MDVYRPAKAETPLPVLILFNTVSGAERGNPFCKAWAEIAASKGLLAIMPDLRSDTPEQDFDALLAHLAAAGASLGADRERIAVYAGSGNVYRGLPVFLNPRRTAVKAAVMYYGSAEVRTFRRDLPILFVRAGLDRPPVTRAMTELLMPRDVPSRGETAHALSAASHSTIAPAARSCVCWKSGFKAGEPDRNRTLPRNGVPRSRITCEKSPSVFLSARSHA
jgi:hypothetical protein